MAATRSDISRWFDDAKEDEAEFMIVVCDTFDHDDFPVQATAADFEEKYKSHNGPNMTRIMEVYDLSLDKETQMAERRAFHFPANYGGPR